MENRGLFIVLEGGEGVGKTTNMAFIQSYLKQHGVAFTHSREPGGTEIAEKIRELVLHKHDENMSELTELLLIFAARAQHLQNVIEPTLAQGKWLLCDRFTDATYAYQGYGRSLSLDVIGQLENLVQKSLRPDCTIILDAPVEVGHARACARAELDRMESEDLSFHQRVRDGYLKRATEQADRYAVIDANKSLESVQEQLKQVLDDLIAKVKKVNHG